MKKMTLGKMARFGLAILLAVVVMYLAGCASKDVAIFINGDTMTVPANVTHNMLDEGQITEDLEYIPQTIVTEETEFAPAKCDVNTRKFYYDQLNDIEKEIYDVFMESTELFIENKKIICCEYPGDEGIRPEYHKYMTRAVHAYMYDNPLSSMWLNNLDIGIVVNDVYVNNEYSHIESFELYISPSEEKGRYADFVNPEEARKAIKQVESEVYEFVSTLTGNDEEKFTKIHDWIIEGASYDDTVSVSNLRSIYGAVIQKNSVCAGFAYAFKYVSDVAGLNSLYITGTGKDEPHAWNYVFVDGKWSLVDVTWDLNPISKGYVSDVPSETFINEDGMLVEVHEYVFVEENNYTYLFADITEESVQGRHINETELEFTYLK